MRYFFKAPLLVIFIFLGISSQAAELQLKVSNVDWIPHSETDSFGYFNFDGLKKSVDEVDDPFEEADLKHKKIHWLQKFFGVLLGKHPWVPTGGHLSPVSPECEPLRLREELRTQSDWGPRLKDYYDRCQTQLSIGNSKGLLALFEAEQIKYNVFDNPNAHSIRLRFSNNESIVGLLALKDDNRKRPLIVIKCGIFCNGDSSSTIMNIMAHLYDEGPFHVLFLASQTGVDVIRKNERLNFGGFYEGKEMMAVGHWLRYESPIRDEIGSLHLMGISLGGHASLFASLYNDHNLFDGKRLFNSALAYCPAINLGPTVHKVFTPSPIGLIFSLWTWNSLLKTSSHVPDIRRILSSLTRRPNYEEYPFLISQLTLEFLSRKSPEDFLAPFNHSSFNFDTDEYWELNNFENHSQLVKTPTLVWSSKNDTIIPYSLNARALAEAHPLGGPSPLQTINLDYGDHCAQSISYGWKSISHTLQGFFLNHTDPSDDVNWSRTLRFNAPEPRLERHEQHIQQTWKALPNRNTVELTYTTWARFKPYECGGARGSIIRRRPRNMRPFTSEPICHNYYTYNISYSDLPIRIQRPPGTKAEAQRLTRKLNANIELLAEDGNPITGRSASPHFARFID